MRVRVLGAGWYGCSIALALIRDGHDVDVHEVADRIFAGASGAIPARLHLGAPHYPRSSATQAACREHQAAFLATYGHLTRPVPVNIYAVASDHSLIDFGTYRRILRDEIEFLTLRDPAEFGLRNVEGAVMVGERHIVCDKARGYFARELGSAVKLGTPPGEIDSAEWDMTIDCTFAANGAAGVDRYEPCLVLLLRGAADKAVTVVDGPFPSLYPWDEDRSLCSLSSARWTPFSKDCRSWAEARALLDGLSRREIESRGRGMVESMAEFFPAIWRYEVVDHRLSIRAMPLSGADTRLVDVARVGERAIRIRAGKIDAVIAAEVEVRRLLAA